MEEEKESIFTTIVGILAGAFMFGCYLAFSMFMFWLCMKCTGYKL